MATIVRGEKRRGGPCVLHTARPQRTEPTGLVQPVIITLYRGASIATAELIAVSTAPDHVAYVAGALLRERQAAPSGDPAASALARGRWRALRLVRAAASSESGGRRGANA